MGNFVRHLAPTSERNSSEPAPDEVRRGESVLISLLRGDFGAVQGRPRAPTHVVVLAEARSGSGQRKLNWPGGLRIRSVLFKRRRSGTKTSTPTFGSLGYVAMRELRSPAFRQLMGRRLV